MSLFIRVVLLETGEERDEDMLEKNSEIEAAIVPVP